MSEYNKIEGVRRDQEIHIDYKMRDTRTFGNKLSENLQKSDSIFKFTLFTTALCAIALPFTMEYIFILFSIVTLITISYGNKRKLLFKYPQSSGQKGADGIYFFGNDKEFNNEELWFSDSDVRKHMLLFGTTGAGKTEALLSLCYGSLLSCSGFIYTDGKGTFELYYKIFNTCRSLAQEDDLLLMSFLTGEENVKNPTTIKISNTLNPFAVADQDESTQLLVSLMSSGGGDGMWKDRASVLMESIMGLLVYRRDYKKRLISVDSIREALILNNIYKAWHDSVGVTDEESPEYLPNDVSKSLHGYLVSLAGFDDTKDFESQNPTIHEQHGYLFMQFTKLLGSLADMYGYIFNTQLSEINFWDVVVNRRILVVLLPALAKSKNELSMLGKIIIACIKQMMKSGLGKHSEGYSRDILNANPTKSRVPFITILDEYGYYAVEGASVMPAQARGLGFFMVFAGQDFAAFAGPSEKEAKTIVANCKIQICMALQDEKETFAIFREKAGEAEVTVTSGKNYEKGTSLTDNKSVNYEKRSRITFNDLTKQDVGEAHFLFEGKLVRGRFFHVNINMKDKIIRVNQFVKVQPPTLEEIEEITTSFQEMKEKISNIQYITSLEEDTDDEGQDEVISEISELFNEYKSIHHSSSLASCATIAHVMFKKHKIIEEEKMKRNLIKSNSLQTSFIKSDDSFNSEYEKYLSDKKDFNIQEIKPYGRESSEFTYDLMQKQMMVNTNINSIKDNTEKSLKDINNITLYPSQAPEIKNPRVLADVIMELNDALSIETDDEYSDDYDDEIPI